MNTGMLSLRGRICAAAAAAAAGSSAGAAAAAGAGIAASSLSLSSFSRAYANRSSAAVRPAAATATSMTAATTMRLLQQSRAMMSTTAPKTPEQPKEQVALVFFGLPFRFAFLRYHRRSITNFVLKDTLQPGARNAVYVCTFFSVFTMPIVEK